MFPHVHRLTRSLKSGLLRRSTVVSPRANHRRDGRLPPGDKTGGRQVRPDPARDRLAVHVPSQQRPVLHDREQVGGRQERARQVHQQVHGHVEGPDAAEDTDRGQEHHDEGAAARSSTKFIISHAPQPRGRGLGAALLGCHDAVVAWGRVLPQCFRQADWGLGKRGDI